MSRSGNEPNLSPKQVLVGVKPLGCKSSLMMPTLALSSNPNPMFGVKQKEKKAVFWGKKEIFLISISENYFPLIAKTLKNCF